MVSVPFQHHPHKPSIFDDKLAPNLEKKVTEKKVAEKKVIEKKVIEKKDAEKDAEKKVDEWWKSIPIPWKGLRVLIIRHGELKGRTAIVRDVAFGRKNLSGLAIYVELEIFGSLKVWIEYENAIEEQ